mmetsp:Transcript_28280/g.41033  ORF Transcript_28280/g.41033 Transcript_28280/m.41033 type:complete len:332 (-) Transcript_28280:687-1682(-)
MMESGSRLKTLFLTMFLGSVLLSISMTDIRMQNILEENYVRRLSLALSNGGCKATPAKLPDPPFDHPVAFVASYPGSGARMTWNLIEALTGLVTGDDWNTNGHGRNVVTVKTHYPQKNGQLVSFADEIPRVVLIVRNIKNAMPSLHNFRYEDKHRLENHSTRAPLEAWIQWRNQFFAEELESWMQHLTYWVDKYPSTKRLVLAYEDMTDDRKGPISAVKIGSFLSQEKGVEPFPRSSVRCIWDVVVKNKGDKTGNAKLEGAKYYVGNDPNEPSSLRKGGTTNKPYTKFQIDSMIGVMTSLKEKYGKNEGEFELIQILDMYLNSLNDMEHDH